MRRCRFLFVLSLFLGMPAIAENFVVGVGDDCASGTDCFFPDSLTIHVGDSVKFVPTGAIRTCSIVPDSFSRTTESAVDVTAISIVR